MFKQVVKYTLMAVLWKKYGVVLLSTLLLFAYFWLVGKLHSDFIAYVEFRGSDEHLGISFIIKWVLFAVGLITYLGYVFFWNSRNSTKSQKAKSPQAKHMTAIAEGNQKDAFAEIRSRGKLRSRSDLVIEKYPEKSIDGNLK